ncbi:MAG: N(G),N(G)-dimethylarginine dimethylaminohydrolase [Anaerolineaceae bacterium]|nr:N(G),N(G)-dimethylarginine dimethylaminohydrolase [Anaerolineaceae bacterium]
MNFKNAIVRQPGKNFSQGLTTANLGSPDELLALEQHAAYCRALQDCGLKLATLGPDLNYPDSTFVEDPAILLPTAAIITRPGAASRAGEVVSMRRELGRFYSKFYEITSPGTLEGGDICKADNHFFIGISNRTNEEGARQLSEFLAQEGYTSSMVDIRNIPGILHLKTGIAYLGNHTLILVERLRDHPMFKDYRTISVDPQENYAANCILINGRVLIAKGFPKFQSQLEALGYNTLPLEVSEFEKMDGGLSCLSLRF